MNEEDFAVSDIIRIMDEDIYHSDWLYYRIKDNGIKDDVLQKLRRYITDLYKNDKIFERGYKEKISQAEQEMPEYLNQFYQDAKMDDMLLHKN